VISTIVVDRSRNRDTAFPLQSPPLMLRSVLVTTLLVGVSGARADSSLPGGATIKFNRLFLHEDNSDTLVQPKKTPDSLWNYFNLAHCVCAQPAAAPDSFLEKTFAYELLLQGQTTPIHRPLEIWVGSECDNDVTRPVKCRRIDAAGIADIASIATTNGVKPEVSVYDLMVPEAMPEGCEPRAITTGEWVIADGNGDNTYDYFLSQSIDTDSLAPPLPTDFTVEGAENAIQIKWTAPAGDVADVAYYQALCATDLGDPALTSPPAPRYMTARRLCDAALDVPLKPSDVNTTSLAGDGGLDAGVDADVDAAADDAGGSITLVDGLARLDPAFICGEQADKTATSMRIDGLQNGQAYTVVFLAIDKFGNAAGTYFTSKMTPKPVTDFWEDLHDQGSDVQGGFCLIADTYGDGSPLTRTLRAFRDDTLAHTAYGRWLIDVYYATLAKLGPVVQGHLALRVIAGILLLPLVALALAWHFLTLPGLLALLALPWMARHRRRVLRARMMSQGAAAAVLVLVLFAPARAHAQTPYWDNATTGNDASTAVVDQPDRVKWHVGVRVGPYTPQIDAQLGKNPGPYRAMFGAAASILPMLDVDRVLWRGFGQLGVGGSVGYLGKSAHAFVEGSDPTDPNRPRATGDTVTFRLLPIAATVVYRFSWLDDEYGIPLVPYARGGLAYYVWWSNAPNGDLAKVCNDGGMEPSCGQNTAAGASLGVQGSIGLAIRAERIDQAAANSMHDGGIEHAGFYAELDMAKVDGFGSSKKLAVGDTTWFAGVDFEF
jgi:hypothetical protein